jgi:Bacterial Ig-like domain/PKD domain
MKALSRLARAQALALGVGLILATPIAVASAAAAPLEIETPQSGSFTRDQTPTIAGTSKDPVDPIVVELFAGQDAEGTPTAILEAPASEAWSVTPSEPLKPGLYTARARQEILPGVTVEALSTFTIDTSRPLVTLAPLPSPSSDMTPTFSGGAGTAAGDLPLITVRVFTGSAPSGHPAETLRTSASGATWTAGPAPALPEGEYTAVAEQSDLAGNVGRSESVTYVLAPGDVPPTASFTSVPASPRVGEPVTLVSTSLGGSSAITSYAWDPTGTGPFVAGGPAFTTTFTSVGAHLVRLIVTDAHGNTALAHASIHVTSAHPRMQPFPLVRIAGKVTPQGARIRLLSVQAPPGALVTIRCRGRGCRVKPQSRFVGASATSAKTGATVLSFPSFERRMPGGTVLQIEITRGSEVGKYTSFRIRRARLPVRYDACVEPSNPRPVACPSS